MYYCNVQILDIVHSSLDRPFTYKIPDKLFNRINPGCLVEINFRGKRVKGIVISITSNPGFDDKSKIKNILSLYNESPVITWELMELAYWMKKYYLCPLSRIFRTMLPRGLLIDYSSKYDKFVKLNYNILNQVKIPSNAKRQLEIVEYLKNRAREEPVHLKVLQEELGCSLQPINRLAKQNIVTFTKRKSFREPVDYDSLDLYPPKSPTQEQKDVLEFIARNTIENKKENKPILLYGVTGSGKTEIYLNMIERVLKAGKEVIVLIPEISLTPQTISRFVGRFGRKVAVIHSRLGIGEKFDEWFKVLNGDAKIVIGARSAVFAPFSNLGLVVIDEEHENTYKQEESPRYHAREVARQRCNLSDAGLILGSATPSLESYYNVTRGVYKITKLKRRINNKNPQYELVDMREELAGKNKSIFSRKLIKEIKKALDEKGRILLFLNRRGYSTFVLCRNCGYVIRCPDCEISLTYHKSVDYLRCHYCDYVESYPEKCLECDSTWIKSFGSGTQKIESEVKKFFPWLKTLRMDVDTTSRKGSHERILEKFDRKEGDVLIGTQMIAKGLDFPDISLVGVISADTILNIPDFRSGERTFQLLSQVAGRGGRGEKVGKVVLQTYTPEHYSIKSVLKGDYENFAAIELEAREKLQYPPFKNMIKFVLRGVVEEDVEYCANKLGESITLILEKELSEPGKNQEMEIMGPYPCPFYKIRGEYRWQLIIKDYDLDEFKEVLEKRSLGDFIREYKKDVKLAIDVDPISLL